MTGLAKGGISVSTIGRWPPLTCEKILHRAKHAIMSKCAKSFSFWGRRLPDPLLELGRWTKLEDFRSPIFPSCIAWQWVHLLQYTVVLVMTSAVR